MQFKAYNIGYNVVTAVCLFRIISPYIRMRLLGETGYFFYSLSAHVLLNHHIPSACMMGQLHHKLETVKSIHSTHSSMYNSLRGDISSTNTIRCQETHRFAHASGKSEMFSPLPTSRETDS